MEAPRTRRREPPDAVRPGIYVHVPFCRERCGYCSFNVAVGADRGLRRRYVEALLADVRRLAAAGPRGVAPLGAGVGHDWPEFGSVFVGGGTPTQLAAADLARVLHGVRAALPVAADAEVTVEANPEDLDVPYLTTLVEAGATRLSIGAQSAVPHVLAFLDRRHDPDSAWRAVEAARSAGVASLGVDLVYGAPAESGADWRASLEAALAAGVDHLSCYSLTLERNTPYAAEVRARVKPPPDDDVAAERMAVAAEVLAAAGFVRYETSNWARSGHASRHNRMYWSCGSYLGIGAGAHGHWAGRRWWNRRPAERYASLALANIAPVAGEELLDADQQRLERLLLGLRTAEGVPRAAVEPLDAGALAGLAAAGLVVDDPERIRLTTRGHAVAEAVTRQLA